LVGNCIYWRVLSPVLWKGRNTFKSDRRFIPLMIVAQRTHDPRERLSLESDILRYGIVHITHAFPKSRPQHSQNAKSDNGPSA
jgi:hypothetical protein